MPIFSRRTWLLAIILCLLLTLCSCNAPPNTARVTQVIDGDTIVIESDYRVRYIGIDSPEIHPQLEAYGIEAWQTNRLLIEGKSVRLEWDVSEADPHGRLLRYTYVDSVFINTELVM
jgi:micrococcal nuclease